MAGFIAAGMDVTLVGPLPTPAIAMLTRSLRAEQLDAIVLEWVVAGGDHHAEVGAHGARQHGDGGRG